jgi:hypothetical protein
MTLWTLAQQSADKPDSGSSWTSPATILAMAALACSILLPIASYFLNWWRTRDDVKAAQKAAIEAATDRKEAKLSADIAAREAAEATRALQGIDSQLGEANQLSRDKAKVDYRVFPTPHPDGPNTSIGLIIENKSLERPLYVKAIGIQDGDGGIRRLSFTRWDNDNEIKAQDTRELRFSLQDVATAGAAKEAGGARARMVVQCSGDGIAWRWIRHLDAQWFLKTAAHWISTREANQHLALGQKRIPFVIPERPTELEALGGNPPSCCD